MSAHTRSIFMLLLTMLIWGSTFVVTKGVIAQVPPFALGFLRVAIGAAALLALAALNRSRSTPDGELPARRSLPWRAILAMALVGVALYYSAFNAAFLYTSASQGALIQSCIPAVTAFVAVVWLRERASPRRWLGIALTIAGVLVIVSGQGSGGASAPVLGGVLMFATTVCWGLYTSLAKRVADFDPVEITAGVTAAGALMLLPAALVELAGHGLPQIEPAAWLGIAYLGAVASGVAYLLYNAALKHMDASQAGVYTNLIPIVGVISGILVLGEPLSLRAILGGCVVLGGVWLTGTKHPVTSD